MSDQNIVSISVAPPTDASGSLLEAQKDVLEMIVRGDALPKVLAALCQAAETHAGPGARASISIVEGIAHASVPGPGALGSADEARAWSTRIASAAGKLLGRLVTSPAGWREPVTADRQVLDALARTAALAIERAAADMTLLASNRRNQFLAELATATQPLTDPDEVMATTARLLAEHLGVDRCAYAPVENERTFVITGDYSRGPPSIVGRWEVEAFGAGCVRDMLAGVPYVVEDSESDPGIGPTDLPAYRATQIRAVICVPLFKGGKFSAAMAVHQTVPRLFTRDEINLVTLVVARCWEALERVRVSRTLRESEARYRAIVEATPECVKILSSQGALLNINAAGLAMIETDEAHAIGASIYDVIAPEHRERFRAFNERVCQGEGGELEFEIVGLRGTRRSMNTTAVPLRSTQGDLLHLAITRDVSARVNADRALVQNRTRLDYAVRLSGVGFWYCPLPFSELFWDERVKEHFFLPRTAQGITIDDFFARIHPDDRVPTRSAIDAAIDARRSYDTIYRTVDPASDSIKWIRALGGATYSPDGTPTYFDGVTVDVTAEKEAQERLATALARVSEQDRRKDEFLATLAHELRNPLAPISTGLQILRSSPSPEQLAKTRQMMERQLHHMVRMVDDLLDISRITLGKVILKRERVDFRAVLNSALDSTQSLVAASGHKFSVDLPDEPLTLDVDSVRVGQVIANLINNAAKYTPPGGRIQVQAAVEGGTLAVRVSDSGMGIPAEMLSRVFEMFVQVSRSVAHSQGGLGIGLTLVRGIVELHGGSIEAASPGEGCGSTFTMRLPLASLIEHAAEVGTPAPGSLGSRRVLVVDDNVDAAESLAMLLEIDGHQMRIAHTGEAALEVALEFQPHIVFLDIGLPRMSGYEVAHRLRANPKLSPNLHIVALTGWGAEEDRRRAKAAGFDQHLVKPVDAAALASVFARN